MLYNMYQSNSYCSSSPKTNILRCWMSEWLLFIFQLYHGENKLIFNEMMMRFALF
jgi:hypothetical protein